MQRDADAYELAIADIAVNKGAVSISQANITDLRLDTTKCGIVHGTVNQLDTTTLWNQYKARFEEDSQKFQADFNTWFNTVKGSLSGDVAGNLQNQIINLQQSFTSHSADTMNYSILKSNLDANGIYTTVQHKRKDGTLILSSILSGGTSPNYTTRTETYYKADGTTIEKTVTYVITYDINGMVASEVVQ